MDIARECQPISSLLPETLYTDSLQGIRTDCMVDCLVEDIQKLLHIISSLFY